MRVVLVMLVLGMVALTAGCGGGSKKPSITLESSTSVTKPSSGSNGTPSFANAKNCQDLAGIAAQAAAAVQASGNGGATLNTEASVLQGLANAAPADIHGDFETVAAAFSGFVNTLQKSGYKLGSKTPPTPAQAAAFAKAAKSFNTAKLRHAEQHLSAWARQNCKGVNVGG